MEHLKKIFIVFSSIITGVFIGYQRQVMADSGERYSDKISLSIAIAVLSYLAAALICTLTKHKYKELDFIWSAIIGSAFCSLFLNVIKYLYDNRRFSQSRSMLTYIFEKTGDSVISFLVAFSIYSLFSLFVFSFIFLSGKWIVGRKLDKTKA